MQTYCLEAIKIKPLTLPNIFKYATRMKQEFKGINSIQELKLKLNQDIHYLANEIDRVLEKL